MGATSETLLLGPADEAASEAVLGVLTTHGIVFDLPVETVTTLLDTVDGRLHRAGLRLVAEAAVAPRQHGRDGQHGQDGADRPHGVTLVLDGPSVVPARVQADRLPGLVGEVPTGPLRDRVERLVDVRALLPVVRYRSQRREGTAVAPEGGPSCRVVVHEQVTTGENAELGTTVEIHPVRGLERVAREVARLVAVEGRALHPGDTLDLVVAASGVEPAGRVWSPTVPLDPRSPALDGVRDVLANLADTIEGNWDDTVAHTDPEFLHDLRVAVRRTRAVVGQMRRVLPPALVEEGRAGFAHLGRLTGPARDLDVYLIEWSRYVDPLGPEAVAALAPVEVLLRARQAAAHADLDRALSDPAARSLLAHWQADLAGLAAADATVDAGPHAHRRLGRVVRQRIERAQRTLVTNGRRIDDHSPAEQVHDLRKDAKQLRYLLECFGSLLPDRPRDRFVKRLKAFQDNLGEHQDAEVHVAVIREIAEELHAAGAVADTLLALGQLMERLEQIRVAARREFAERFAAYDTPATERALADALESLRS
jgi:CHAD domain-containing protein